MKPIPLGKTHSDIVIQVNQRGLKIYYSEIKNFMGSHFCDLSYVR